MKIFMLTGLLLTVVAALPPGVAQEQRSSTLQLEEVVVTARKMAESLQDAPAAIDVIGVDRLQAIGVTDIRAVQFLVPSIRLNKQQSVAQMFIRGVGIASDAPGLDMGVVMTFNGIEQFREATGSSLFDLERVEVLRGPQATTYGSNAAGGVINVVFARPSNDFSGRASVEVGNYDRVHASAAQNFALGDRAQMRIALDALDRDGFASNGLDDQDTRASRLTFTAQPTDNFDFMLWGSTYRAKGIGDVGYASPFVDRDDPWNQTWNPLAIVAHFPGQALRNRDIELFEFGGELNLKFRAATLTYIPGYARLEHLGHLVIDTGPARILFQGDVERRQDTHELRLAGSDPKSRLQWLTGLYYYQLDTSELRTVGPNRSFDIPEQPSEAIAAYGEATYALTDPLRLTLGLRYSELDKSAAGSRFTPGPTPTPIPFSADLGWDHVDWKVGLQYDVNPQSMLYVAVQTGYLGGGINFFSSPTQSNEVKPEELMAYIVGLKSAWLDERLRFNSEAFYYDWENYQVGLFNIAAATNIVFNASKSEAYGLEFDMNYQAGRADQLTLGLGFFHGEFTDFVVPAGVSSPVRTYDFTGLELPFAPEFSAAFSYEHTFDFAGGSRLVAGAQLQYSSEFWTSFSHGITRCSQVSPAVLPQSACIDDGTRQPDATLINADLTWHLPGDRWRIGLWGRNLTDEPIRASGGDGGMNAAGVVTSFAASTLTPPRTYGVRLSAQW